MKSLLASPENIISVERCFKGGEENVRHMWSEQGKEISVEGDYKQIKKKKNGRNTLKKKIVCKSGKCHRKGKMVHVGRWCYEKAGK